MLDATVGADPADAITAERTAHIPKIVPRRSCRRDGCKGARIGVLRALFGTAPEDEEVAEHRAQGARRDEGARRRGRRRRRAGPRRPAARQQRRSATSSSSTSPPTSPGSRAPPVKSLGEILERGLHHAALDQTLPAAQRARDARHRALPSGVGQAARAARSDAVASALDGAAPRCASPIRRCAASRRSSARSRRGRAAHVTDCTTCQLSATSGLPAISMPAGFTVDGLPIGLELLGGAFAEADAADVRLRLGAGRQRRGARRSARRRSSTACRRDRRRSQWPSAALGPRRPWRG